MPLLLLRPSSVASRFNGDATEALGNIGDARAVQPLIQAMVNPENQSKEAYARALGKLGSPAAEPLLTLLKRKDSYTEGLAIGRAALSALAQTGDRRAVPFLIKALEDRDIVVADEAWSALGKLKDPRAIAPLIESLKLEPGEAQGGVFDRTRSLSSVPLPWNRCLLSCMTRILGQDIARQRRYYR